MAHTPHGYRIENGKAVIDETAAEQVKTLFASYLSGDSLDTASNKSGILSVHGSIGRILQNTLSIPVDQDRVSGTNKTPQSGVIKTGQSD